jgi:hypothetical protein
MNSAVTFSFLSSVSWADNAFQTVSQRLGVSIPFKFTKPRKNGKRESYLHNFPAFNYESGMNPVTLVDPFFFVVEFPLTSDPFLRGGHHGRLPLFQVFGD